MDYDPDPRQQTSKAVNCLISSNEPLFWQEPVVNDVSGRYSRLHSSACRYQDELPRTNLHSTRSRTVSFVKVREPCRTGQVRYLDWIEIVRARLSGSVIEEKGLSNKYERNITIQEGVHCWHTTAPSGCPEVILILRRSRWV